MYVYFFLVMTTCVSLTRASRASDWGRRKMASTALCIKKIQSYSTQQKRKREVSKRKGCLDQCHSAFLSIMLTS
jgi:hypothetical protein